jgi:sugar diacid utilization regulator
MQLSLSCGTALNHLRRQWQVFAFQPTCETLFLMRQDQCCCDTGTCRNVQLAACVQVRLAVHANTLQLRQLRCMHRC